MGAREEVDALLLEVGERGFGVGRLGSVEGVADEV